MIISVIMGTHNGRSRIDRAIESIKNQTFKDWELIICDDGSTDGTYEHLKKTYSDDSRIIITKLDQNLGLSSALNRCIELSKGTMLARMDDDDYSHPDRFEKQLKVLNEHPELALVSCNTNFFDENGIYGCSRIQPTIRTKKDIFLGRVFAHPTVIMRKNAITAVGGYTVSKLTKRGQDYDLWCKLYHAGYKGMVMEEILFDYYESRLSIKNRTRKSRLCRIPLKLSWRRKLQLPIWYDLSILHNIAVILLPQSIYTKIRRKRYNILLKGQK